MENSVIIVDRIMAEQIQVASLFDNSPFRGATILKLSNDRYYINFNAHLSNTTLFLCGIYLADINKLHLEQFIEFEDLNND
jgi:hypothetical protein